MILSLPWPGAPHFLAGVVAAGDHDAGVVAAGNHGQWRAEPACGVDDVERVHRGRVYLDEHLPGARLRHRFATIGQRLRWRPAGLDDDRVHPLGVGGHVQILSLFAAVLRTAALPRRDRPGTDTRGSP